MASHLPHEIRVYGMDGRGKCVLVREGEDDIDLSALLAITAVESRVDVGCSPRVKLEVVARLVHVP